MFYLTTHSTHFIYGYMVSDIWLRTILIVRKETRCRHIGYSFRLTARVLLYAPSHRQDSTYHGLCYTSRKTYTNTHIQKHKHTTHTHTHTYIQTNECLTIPQHKNKIAFGCQTNGIYIKKNIHAYIHIYTHIYVHTLTHTHTHTHTTK